MANCACRDRAWYAHSTRSSHPRGANWIATSSNGSNRRPDPSGRAVPSGDGPQFAHRRRVALARQYDAVARPKGLELLVPELLPLHSDQRPAPLAGAVAFGERFHVLAKLVEPPAQDALNERRD